MEMQNSHDLNHENLIRALEFLNGLPEGASSKDLIAPFINS